MHYPLPLFPFLNSSLHPFLLHPYNFLSFLSSFLSIYVLSVPFPSPFIHISLSPSLSLSLMTIFFFLFPSHPLPLSSIHRSPLSSLFPFSSTYTLFSSSSSLPFPFHSHTALPLPLSNTSIKCSLLPLPFPSSLRILSGCPSSLHCPFLSPTLHCLSFSFNPSPPPLPLP